MTNPPSDLGIPLLTEVIGAQGGAETAGTAPADAAAKSAIPAFLQMPPVAAPAPAPAPIAVPTPASPAQMQALGAPRIPPPAAVQAFANPAATPPAFVSASQPAAAPAAPATPAESELNVPTLSRWSDAELDELQADLRQRITRQVLGRIDFVLDHRVRNTLSEVLDGAVDALAAEIKRGLHETLSDMVARAVAQEVARLQPPKK